MAGYTVIHRGHVSEGGKLVLADREGFLRAMHAHAGKDVEVVVRRVRGAEEEAHDAMKWMFLRRPADVDGAPDTVRSTADLTSAEFSEYCEQIRRWAATNLGIDIPDPGRVEAA